MNKRYDKYKDSGVEWIGKIPEHWEVKRFKYWFDLITNKLENQNNKIALENVESHTGKFIPTDSQYDGVGIAFEVNDILFGKLRPYLAKVYLTEFKGLAVGDFFVFRGKERTYPKFAMFRILDYSFIEITNSSTYGAKMPRVSWEFIANLFIAFPPNRQEQTIISDYLNHRTAQIDSLITKKQKLIELLKEERTAIINQAVTKGIDPNVKLKSSGIDWLGEIPEHWEVKKLKYLSEVISKGTTPSTIGSDLLVEGKIRFLKAENILQTNIVSAYPEFFIEERTNQLLKRSELKENDILIVIAGATIGKIGILPKKFIPANTNQAVCFIRLKDSNFSKWIWLFLQSHLIKQLIFLASVQAAQPNLSMENIGNFLILVPRFDEIKKIIDFFETETKKIDETISKVEKEIELLQEYRTALISEVVTGKIKVV